MRPPVAAGPIARASSPPNEYESSSTASALTAAGPTGAAGAAADAAAVDAAVETAAAQAGEAAPPRPAAKARAAPARAPRAERAFALHGCFTSSMSTNMSSPFEPAMARGGGGAAVPRRAGPGVASGLGRRGVLRRFLLLLHLRRGEAARRGGAVDLDLVDGDDLRAGRAFHPGLQVERHGQPLDLLVVAERRLDVGRLAPDGARRLVLELEVAVGVEVDGGDVAFLLGQLQLLHRRAFQIALAEVLDLVALVLVVEERSL